VFTEVGMDAVTYTLAFSRMAPIQCTTWGHPLTTGSPAIDWFISSELMETAESDGHYTERLARLPNLGPTIAARNLWGRRDRGSSSALTRTVTSISVRRRSSNSTRL